MPITLECISEPEVKVLTKLMMGCANQVCLGVCCPGGVSKALEYEAWEWDRIFSSGHACGTNEKAVVHNKPTGYVPRSLLFLSANVYSIVRASLGAMTTKRDIQALISFLHNEFVSKSTTMPRLIGLSKDPSLQEPYLYPMRALSRKAVPGGQLDDLIFSPRR